MRRGVYTAAFLLPYLRGRPRRGASPRRIVIWQSSSEFIEALRGALERDGFDPGRVMVVNVYATRVKGRVYRRLRVVLLEPVARRVYRLLYPRVKPVIYRFQGARMMLRTALRVTRVRGARLEGLRRRLLRSGLAATDIDPVCRVPGCLAARLARGRNPFLAAYHSCMRRYEWLPFEEREGYCIYTAYEEVGGDPPHWARMMYERVRARLFG